MIVNILLTLAGVGLLVVIVAEYGGRTRVGRTLRRLATKQPKSIAELDSYASLSLEELALVEKYVPQLLSVVILCHRVDQPSAGLAKAVLDNFQQGAAYTFFVSPDEAQDADLVQYQEWFEHIFHAARGAAPASGENAKIRDRSFGDVFAIKRLPLMWANVPYVFYTFEPEPNEFATITFKGTQPGVGISEIYDRVGATEARAIMDLCSAASAAFCPAIGEKSPELDQPIPDQAISNVKVLSFPRLARNADDQTPTPRQWIN